MIHTHYLLTSDKRECPIRSLEIPGKRILDACSVQASYGHLLVLVSDGEIYGVSLDSGVILSLCSIELPDLPIDEGDGPFGTPAWKLHANLSGTFCAVVVDKGRKGVVVDTTSGIITMYLDGGDYYEETVPFSACFLRIEDKEVFVHRSAWNRLDASDPVTGSSLTERHIDPYEDGGARPAHYLDYFHGRLLPSPDGRRILDDGWIWHPVSVPRIWSAADWLCQNPWESEDGTSVVEFNMRDDWNTPACWLSDRHVAMWGVVDWDDQEFEVRGIQPGVQIYDATSNERTSDEQWLVEMGEVPQDLFSDGEHLFIVGERRTSIWDIESRSMISAMPDFSARLHDTNRRTLVAIDGNRVAEVSLPWLMREGSGFITVPV